MPQKHRLFLFVLFACHAALLLSNVLILPPFEGFDETAHYSYISMLADAHQIPDFRSSPLDEHVEDLQKVIPGPYASVPPYERNGGITYQAFFQANDKAAARASLQALWSTPTDPATYRPARGETPNWQGQHPPLYYLAMALPYQLTKGMNWGLRILALRSATVLLVLCGLYFIYRGICLFPLNGNNLLLTASSLVLFFPSLFHDVARLGNDGMVLCLFSILFYLLTVHLLTAAPRIRLLAAIGLVLGLGMLTKLFFLFIGVGLSAFVLADAIVVKKRSAATSLGWVALIWTIALGVSGWWFVHYYLRYGTALGSHETYVFAHTLSPVPLSLRGLVEQWLRGQLSFMSSLLWAGTWSWLRRPLWHYLCILPLFLLVSRNMLAIAPGFVRRLRHLKLDDLDPVARQWLLALCLMAPVIAGFFYHNYLRVKYTGVGMGSAGYYLFSMWPAIFVLLSIGMFSCRTRWNGALLAAASVCLLGFELAGHWSQIQVYSGFVAKTGDLKQGTGGLPFNLSNLHLVLETTRDLVFPYSAVSFYALSLLGRTALLGMLVSQAHQTCAPAAAPARPAST